MAHVAIDADVYAATRQNIFFPGITPDLDGQCVSLVKWFMQDMSDVPNPQAARGDARYVGKTLVAQGQAIEVPYDQRKEGDIICYEFGTYGHIAVQLSGGRVFEENVNLGGVSRKLVAGAWVYASRIGNEGEAWRNNQHVYRLKSYNGGIMMTEDGVRYGYKAVTGKEVNTGAWTNADVAYWTGRDSTEFNKNLYVYSDSFIVAANRQIADLEKQLAAQATPLPKGKYWVQ